MSNPTQEFDVKSLQLAQGPAKLASSEDEARDASGITHPNLHIRQVDEPTDTAEDQVDNENYTYYLTVSGKNAYITRRLHDRSSSQVDNEIP